MRGLSAPVGLAATNRASDVVTVQRLLLASDHSPGMIDGVCGRRTIGAIVSFQREFLRQPDGRVDVDGPTYRRLRAGHHHRPAPAVRPSPAARPTRTTIRAPQDAGPVARRPAAPRPTPRSLPSRVDYNERLPVPPADQLNIGLRSPPNSLLERKFGLPRTSFGRDCQPPTNPRLRAVLVTQSVGPFRVTGLRPAVESLRAIMGEIERDLPDLYRLLGTEGMACCRYARGSTTSISNHSWGTAVDIKIGPHIVPRGVRYVEVGLQMMAPYFNRHGWFWGAGFRRTKDPHHYECSASLLESFDI